MSSYTIHYFPIRGLVEGWRLLLEDAGVSYNEVKVTDWSDRKADYIAKGISSFHQLPVLELDGKYFTQSSATSRFLAKSLGYYGGQDASVQYACDAIDDAVTKDWRSVYGKVVYPADESQQAELQKKYIAGDLQKFLGIFEACLAKQEKGEHYIAGKNITFADFTLWEMLDLSKTMAPSCLEQYPLLNALYNRIAERPNVKAYLASGKRPEKINGSRFGYAQ